MDQFTPYIIPVLSLIVAMASVGSSFVIHRLSLRASARPVLVFVMVGNDWELRNVGQGPAVIVTLCDESRSGAKQYTNCFPISPGDHVDLHWLPFRWGLSVYYKDVDGREFVTICSNNRNKFIKGDGGQKWVPTAEEWQERLEHLKKALIPELEGKSAWELDVLRNEIFARRGYIFTRPDLQEYFSAQPWYEPKSRMVETLGVPFYERWRATAIMEYQKEHGLTVTDD